MAFDLGFFSSLQHDTSTRRGWQRTIFGAAIVVAGLAGADGFSMSPLPASRPCVPAAQPLSVSNTAGSQLLARSLTSSRGQSVRVCAKQHFVSRLRAAASSGDIDTNKEEMYAIAHDNFARWNNAVQEKSYERTSALYSKTESDLSLPDFMKDSRDTDKLFQSFIEMNWPAGNISGDDVYVLSKDSYLHTGTYKSMEGGSVPKYTSFSSLWKRIEGEWKICHSHSTKPSPEMTSVSHDVDLYPTAQENFVKWTTALRNKEYDKAAHFYSSDPTFASSITSDKDSLEKISMDFFSRLDFVKSLPPKCIISDNVQAYGSDAYLHTGIYTFRTKDSLAPVVARFSYIWRKIEGDWKIVHHHSSGLTQADVEHSVQDGVEVPEAVKQDVVVASGATGKEAVQDAVMSRTFSAKNENEPASEDLLRTAQANFQTYFLDTKRLPTGSITAEDVQSLGDDAYLHSGMYKYFTGPHSQVNANFSCMWRRENNEWKVTHQHSSALATSTESNGDTDLEKLEHILEVAPFKSVDVLARAKARIQASDLEEIAPNKQKK